MLKQRTVRWASDRSLPQRNEQFNTYPHRIYVSPRLIRKAGFNSRAILADAQVSGRVGFHWAKRYLKIFNRVIRRHIFGFFVISLSSIQILSATSVDSAQVTTDLTKSNDPTFHASVAAKGAPVFQWPINGYISQSFWFYHPAIDIPNPYGAGVKPIAEGVVVYSGWEGGYGYTVVIKHKAGFSSRYAHLSQVSVKRGARVNKKTTIGTVGATGFATGSHLHLEVYNDGKVVNPQNYLP